ncbi:nitroreductase family deazaflavin-dependent oxidoreductase [Nocardia huaxiensis]|uniref:nitroreductase family deazaflavin-dependent oxidoreductase n=1 Tax=Nocardia huaxiensis TaxID=2755382 RepID=UPI0030B80812
MPVSEVKHVNEAVIAEFRANAGKVGGILDGIPVVLLHHTGAKTGQPRITPLCLFELGDRRFVPGSFSGRPIDPAWVHNVRAHPDIRAEIGTHTYTATARELPTTERDPIFNQLAETIPTYAQYQARTERVIPIFELTNLRRIDN